MKNKHKGHLMLEALFSIALLALIASTIFPNIISLLENQNYIREREELISGKRRGSDEEIKMEIYLPKKGLFTN